MPTDNMNKINTQKGYTLLMAVLITTIVLSVALLIISLSRKEFILSSGARDSMYAFYAADSGIECASENLTTALSTTSGATTITSCGATTGWTITRTWLNNDPTTGVGTSTFFMPVGVNATGAQNCVRVDVGQWYNPTSGSLVSNIEARGYNTGWNTTVTPSDCSLGNLRKVERAIRLLYQ